jgi:uncharacterized protein YdeI (YjbR/CyaY-like superfamily)
MPEQNGLFFSNRDEWRSWLELNHDKSDGIWVIYFKKNSGKKSLGYSEGVEEALCFGWIDSLVKSIDNERYKQKYTPRRKNSVWSEINRKRVEKMVNEGKMTAAGLKMIEEAKQNGHWQRAYGTAIKQEMPEDLIQALLKSKKAHEHFFKFAPGHQNTYIYWLNSAKRRETRLKRIEKIIKLSEENKKPGIN